MSRRLLQQVCGGYCQLIFLSPVIQLTHLFSLLYSFTVCLPETTLEPIDLQNLDTCALVSAEVSVTAASLYRHLTVAELRGDVVSMLNEAFANGMMERLFG